MSFIDKLGQTLKDAGWAIGAPVGAAIDVAKALLPGGDPAGQGVVNAVTQGFQHGTQLFFGETNPDGTHSDNLVSPLVNKANDALDWVYREGISRPINFGNIEAQRAIADVSGTEDNASVLDFGSAWDRASNTHGGYDDKGTSIGREAAYTMQGFLGSVFGTNGHASTLTDEGQRALNEGKGAAGKTFDIESGYLDATARMFLDPTIVLGKAAKVVRATKTVAGLRDASQIESKLAQTRDWLFEGWGKRHDQAIGFATSPNRTAGELMAAFPGLREGDGPSVASVIEQTNKGMRAAGKSDEEIADQVKLITRASLGDATALKSISSDASAAKDALAAMQSNRDDLKTASEWATKYADRIQPQDIHDAAQRLDLVKDLEMRGQDYFTSDEFLKLTDARLNAVKKDVDAAEKEAARQERIRRTFLNEDQAPTSAFGGTADQPMLSSAFGSVKGLEKRAAKERGDYQNAVQRAAVKAAAPIGLDGVIQSTGFNKAIRIGSAVLTPHLYLAYKGHQAFQKMAQPSVIDVHDDQAPLQLDTFLKHSKLDSETRLGLVSKMAAASGNELVQRQTVEQAIQLAQESMVKAYRDKNPHFTDDVEKLVNTALAKEAAKTSARQAAHTMAFTASKRADGTRADLHIGDDGLADIRPLFETQLVNSFALPNLRATEHILRRHSNWVTDMAAWAKGDRAPDPNRVQQISEQVFGQAVKLRPGLDVRTANRLQAVNDFAWKSDEVAKSMLEGFTKLWKWGTLALRAPAYSARNNFEAAMRFNAALGPAAWVMNSSPRLVGYGTLGGASRARQAFLSYKDNQASRQLEAAMEKLEDAHGTGGEKLAKGVDAEYDQLAEQHAALQAKLDRYRTGGRAGRREVYGAFGEAGYRPIQTRAGELAGAFAGPEGVKNRWIVSSKTTANLLGDSQKLAAKESQLGNWTYVENTDPTHMDNWLHAVNNQLLQSKIGKKAVDLVNQYGATDRARVELAKWMGESPEGKALMGKLQWTWANKGDRAGEVVGYVNHYLPTRELQAKAAAGRLKQTDLESAIPNVEDRPMVHGEQVAMALGRGSIAGKAINDAFSAIMRWAGDATEDQLARHPMYAAVYEQEVKRRAEFMLAHPGKDQISLDEIRRVIQEQAHQKARSTIRKYMFDVAHTSDLSHYGRFVSPFIAAWEDTVRKWGTIIKEDPSVLGRANQIWNAPNMMGIVVDENGNPVHDRDGFTDNHYIVIPRGISKHLPGGADSNFRISKQALNLVLQGGLQPGFGPLVAYPVGKLQTQVPTLDKVARLVNPYGPPSSVFDSVAPSVVKQMYDAVNTQTRDHQADTRRIYAQLLTQYRLDPEKFGGREPTIDDASKRAGDLGILKVLNRVVQPFPAIYDSPFKLYQDAYHTLKDRERTENHPQGWADDQFIQQYGDTYFPLVQSMSLNQGGLGSTKEAVQAVKKYQPLINQVGIDANGQPNKTLIRLIVGQEGEGQFNQSAQAWQEQHDIVAGSGERYRTYKNPVQAQADADASLGWYKYRQFMNTLDAQALQQGLQTYADSPDLVATKQEFVHNLTAENPSWGADYSSFDSGQFDRNYQALTQVADSGKFGAMRTDMVGVQQYVALRQALTDQLQQLGIAQGSAEAQPFRQEFTDAVQSLVSSNTQFAEWSYYTFLEHDPLLEPMTSAAQVQAQPVSWGFDQ